MTLYQKLQKATSEEDVKDAYIKALGLKSYSKNLIDIQTDEIWFEAKDSGKHSTYAMFTQLMHYVQDALNKGDAVPPFLCVIDTQKAAIMKSKDVLPFLEKKTIKWGKSASKYTTEALDAISAHIGTYFVSFKIETHEEEFISTIKNAIKNGDIIRTQITPDNLKQVFDKWVALIGKEINGVAEEDYALLFFADIMHDGTLSTHDNLTAELLHKNNAPVFSLNNKIYELGNKEGYRQFWAIYHKPPKAEYRNYLLERRDSLIPIDERSFKGAYYTPLTVVEKAYDKLTATLGKNWQRDYIIWDMCCGVGNLEVKHSNPRNLYMSTLDQADIDVMKATKTCVAATRFQYDYLNDDIDDFGNIDYTLTNKLPLALREAIAEGKKILVLINPPYAEARSGIDSVSKENVSKTKLSLRMDGFGNSSNELYIQFIIRIANEIPNATVAMFSKLKHINAPTFNKFRNYWNAEYKGGFIVHSKSFDGLKGDFPIGFLIWKTNQFGKNKLLISEITTDILNKNAEPIGEKKFFNLPNNKLLNTWIDRPKSNKKNVIPLKNAFLPTLAMVRVSTWSDNAIAYMFSGKNNVQTAGQQTAIFSSAYAQGDGFYVTKNNLTQAAIIFTVRRIVKHTWINDRDQFLQPTEPLSNEFKSDCLLWMLFNGSNLTASANDLEWNDKKWSIVNHFIPYTEDEVGSPERFESDFMVQYIKNLPVIARNEVISPEAKQVYNEGKKLWQEYFKQTDVHTVREELKLNRPDVGWYQVRKALQARNNSGDNLPISFKPFEEAYKALTEKLQPMVYELGFLKN